jgi:hypothetical protein
MRFGKFDLRYLSGVLALAFALLIIMSVRLQQGVEWWAAWGQWVGGIGSIAAAAAALWIAVEGWRRTEQERLDDQKIQARLVLVHFNSDFAEFSGSSVQIHNRSGGHVLDIVIVSMTTDRPGQWIGDHKSLGSILAEEMEPRSKTSCDVHFETPDGTEVPSQTLSPVITICFMDADGRRWTRAGNDEPVRVFGV